MTLRDTSKPQQSRQRRSKSKVWPGIEEKATENPGYILKIREESENVLLLKEQPEQRSWCRRAFTRKAQSDPPVPNGWWMDMAGMIGTVWGRLESRGTTVSLKFRVTHWRSGVYPEGIRDHWRILSGRVASCTVHWGKMSTLYRHPSQNVYLFCWNKIPDRSDVRT